ncbi:MAG: hypothetical protein SWK76_17290 [Actinomycetota bacterium]|nr:hypothetical protein [Actinomycetota bacterium]
MEFESVPLPTFPVAIDNANQDRIFAMPSSPSLNYHPIRYRISGQDPDGILDELDIIGPLVASTYGGGGIYIFDKNMDILGAFIDLDIDDPEQFLDFVGKYGIETSFAHLAGLSYRKTYDHSYISDSEEDYYDVEEGTARFLQLSFNHYLGKSDIKVDHLIPSSYGEDQFSNIYNYDLNGESLEKIRLTVSPYFKLAQRDIKVAMSAKDGGNNLLFLLIVNRYLQWHCRLELKWQLSLLEMSSSNFMDTAENLVNYIEARKESPLMVEYMAPIVFPMDIIGASILELIEQVIERRGKLNFFCKHCKKYLPPENRGKKYCSNKCALKEAQSNPIYRIKKIFSARAERRGLTRISDEWKGFLEELEKLQKQIEAKEIGEDEAKKLAEGFAHKYGLEKRKPGRPPKEK